MSPWARRVRDELAVWLGIVLFWLALIAAAAFAGRLS